METDDSTPPTEQVDLRDLSPEEAPTINQLVAYNMTRARRSRGWTQQEVAERLTRHTGRPWSKASISAAERSWQGGRSRKFDANELIALAVIFDTPVSYFFLPSDETTPRGAVMAQPEDRQEEGAYWVGIPLVLKKALIGDLAEGGGIDFMVRARAAVREHIDGSVWVPPSFLSRERMERARAEVPPPDDEDFDWGEVSEWVEERAARRAETVDQMMPADVRDAFLRKHSKQLAVGVAKELFEMGLIKTDEQVESEEDTSGQQDPPF